MRIALTGSKFGPGIYDIIISLGKDDVEKRLTNKIFLKIKAASFEDEGFRSNTI